MELFDCSPLKNVKPDRTLQTGRRNISKVTNAFSKAVAIALDEPALGQSTDCLNCCWLLSWSKKNLLSLEIGRNYSTFNHCSSRLINLQSCSFQHIRVHCKTSSWIDIAKRNLFNARMKTKGWRLSRDHTKCSCILWE